MASTKRRNFQRPQRARLFRSLAVGLPSGRWSLLPTGDYPSGDNPRVDASRWDAHNAALNAPSVAAHPEGSKEGAEPPHSEERKRRQAGGLGVSPTLSSRAGGWDEGRLAEQDGGTRGPEGHGGGVSDRLVTEDLAETWAEQLLFRYGVVFRDLVQRENITVPWRDILRSLRRMEARGSVRGGRFVAGFYGEQYARPEAVESLRKVRRMEKKGELVRVSAVDPLNLTGNITPGARVTAVHTRSVLYRDGVPLSEEEAAAVLAEARMAKAG